MKKAKLLFLLAASSLLFTSCSAINMDNPSNPNNNNPSGQNEGEPSNPNNGNSQEEGEDKGEENPEEELPYTVNEFDLFQEEQLPNAYVASICNGLLRFRNTFKNATAMHASVESNQDVTSSISLSNGTKEKILDAYIDNLEFEGDLGLSGFNLKDVSNLDIDDVYGYLNLYGFKGFAKVDYSSNRIDKNPSTKAKKEIYANNFDFSDSTINAYLRHKNLYLDLSDEMIRNSIEDMLIDDDLIDFYSHVPSKFYKSLEEYLSSIGNNEMQSAQNVLDYIYGLDRDSLEGLILIGRSPAINSILDEETVNLIKETFKQLNVSFYSYSGQIDKIVSVSLDISSVEDVDYLLDMFRSFSDDINDAESTNDASFATFINDAGINVENINLKIMIDFMLDGSLNLTIDNDLSLDYLGEVNIEENMLDLSASLNSNGKSYINIAFNKGNYLDKIPSDLDLLDYRSIDEYIESIKRD